MELYSITEAAKIVGMSDDSVRAYARALGFKKVNRYFIITTENIEKLRKLKAFLKEL